MGPENSGASPPNRRAYTTNLENRQEVSAIRPAGGLAPLLPADLPDGRMYNQAFQGYSGDLIREAVANNLEIFKSACLALDGHPVELGSAAFAFVALPRLPLLLTFWPGDEDFPASCKVLFDASARDHLPIDVCAILGSQLAGKIIRRIQSSNLHKPWKKP